MGLARCARRHRLRSHSMAVGEQPFQLSAHQPAGQHPSKNTKRQDILDSIFDEAGVIAGGDEAVCVIPPAKRASELDVSKLAALDVIAVFKNPSNPKRPGSNAQHAPVAVANSGRALFHFEWLPGRCQAIDCARLGMPEKYFLSRGFDSRA